MDDEYVICDGYSAMDVEAIHAFLAVSYWAKGVSLQTVDRSMQNSLCFGVFIQGNIQIGFARVVSDKATFAYLADVYVLASFRGRGLSKRLMVQVMQHPDLQGLRRMMLITRDAHSLYQSFGFGGMQAPHSLMERIA